MNQPVEIFLGFDPGGQRHFGWSICRENGEGEFEQLRSGVANNAGDVVTRVSNELVKRLPLAQPVAAGIDAPLFWNRTGQTWRVVDETIEERGHHPVPINGLNGAVLVQGVLLAALLRQQFGDLAITEAYPSALRRFLNQLNQYPVALHRNHYGRESEHRWDARTAAYAAWCMHRQAPGWRNLFPYEPHPVLPLGTPASYWMPIPQQPPG